jgi:hypothetical protein
MSRRTRAYENLMYVISANHGGYAAQVHDDVFADSPGLIFQQRYEGEISPLGRTPGGSEVVDFNGHVVGQAQSPGEALASATIEIQALRERRAEVRGNILAQVRSEIYAKEYAKHRASPLNRWLERPIQKKQEGSQNTREVIDRYLKEGVYAPPEGYESVVPQAKKRRASV